jgi:O-antigen/teichoic acid export membrane protein
MASVSLLRNISWIFFGNVVYALCKWAVLVALAKLTSPEDVGQFALAMAVAVPVFEFSNLQLRTLLATDVARATPFSVYRGLRVVSSVVALLAVVLIAVASAENSTTLLIIVVYGGAKFFESLSDSVYGLLQRHELMKVISQSLMLRGVFSLLLMIVILAFTGSVVWGTLAYLMVWAATYVFFDSRNARALLAREAVSFSPRQLFDVRAMAALLWFALPLAIVMLLNSLSMNIPRYVIAAELGDSQLGFFAAVGAFMVVGATAVGAVGQSAAPRLARYFAQDLKRYLDLAFKMMAFALAVGLAGVAVAWTLGEFVLEVFYTAEYAVHADLLLWIMIAAVPLYLASMSGFAIAAGRRFRAQAVITAVSTATILITSLLMVPSHGLIGGAIALCCGFTFKWLGQFGIVLWLVRARQQSLVLAES